LCLAAGGEFITYSMVSGSQLSWLTKQRVFALGFADNGTVLIVVKVINTMYELMQHIGYSMVWKSGVQTGTVC